MGTAGSTVFSHLNSMGCRWRETGRENLCLQSSQYMYRRVAVSASQKTTKKTFKIFLCFLNGGASSGAFAPFTTL
jgi:hypothetical protein